MKWIIILLAFIGSWEQMKAQQNPIILNEKNVTDLTTAADWDKLIDTWNYVPLENSDNSRLGSIETCYIYGDYLFIKDYHDREMRMMQFKLTGDFMHRVGKYGSGEQEHGALGLPWVDLEKRQITLHDGFSSHKKVTYDLAGKYVSTGKTGMPAFYTRQIYPAGNGKYIGYCACGTGNRMCYFTTDKNFNKFDTLRQHIVTFNMGYADFSIHPIVIYKNNITCIAPLSDTIYTYADNKFIPRFITTTHRSVPADFIPSRVDYWSLLAKLKEKGFDAKKEAFETKNWFIITYDNGKIFYEKNQQKGFYIPKDLPARGDMIYPSDLWGQQGEKLIAIFAPEELLAIKAELEAKGVQLTDKMKTLFGKVKAGENPWLFFYELK